MEIISCVRSTTKFYCIVRFLKLIRSTNESVQFSNQNDPFLICCSLAVAGPSTLSCPLLSLATGVGVFYEGYSSEMSTVPSNIVVDDGGFLRFLRFSLIWVLLLGRWGVVEARVEFFICSVVLLCCSTAMLCLAVGFSGAT